MFAFFILSAYRMRIINFLCMVALGAAHQFRGAEMDPESSLNTDEMSQTVEEKILLDKVSTENDQPVDGEVSVENGSVKDLVTEEISE